jgi:hypothetical protein
MDTKFRAVIIATSLLAVAGSAQATTVTTNVESASVSNLLVSGKYADVGLTESVPATESGIEIRDAVGDYRFRSFALGESASLIVLGCGLMAIARQLRLKTVE